LARLSVQPIPVGDPVVLSSHFAHRIKLISVQREIGSLRQQINSWKRAGKTEDSANLIRRLADLHHQEVLLKQPSPGLCRSRNGLMEGGIRHAEKG
ncbi:MAG TPA: hypothetical protein VJ036_06985, partial [bacterium]|nr:hypothetical protein [bacterium]